MANAAGWTTAVLAIGLGGCGPIIVHPGEPPGEVKHRPKTPTPAASPTPAGLVQGFSAVRPAVKNSGNLSVRGLAAWSHFSAMGGQDKALYDVVIGPAAEGPSDVASLDGFASDATLSLNAGTVYLSGRWVLPLTPRIRGTRPGGLDLRSDTAACPQVLEYHRGPATLMTDGTMDVLLLPGPAPTCPAGSEVECGPLTVVLRGWKAGCTGPGQDAGGACEAPDCVQLQYGQYCVVETDTANRKQKYTVYSWAAPLSDPGQVRAAEVVELVNRKLSDLGYSGFALLPRLGP